MLSLPSLSLVCCKLTILSSSFLQFVSDVKTFDERLQSYLQTDYIREK